MVHRARKVQIQFMLVDRIDRSNELSLSHDGEIKRSVCHCNGQLGPLCFSLCFDSVDSAPPIPLQCKQFMYFLLLVGVLFLYL